jgi:hypothetical protein
MLWDEWPPGAKRRLQMMATPKRQFLFDQLSFEIFAITADFKFGEFSLL